MKKIYVSDILTEERVKSWKENSIIRLKADMGTGKSYWVGEVLGNITKESGGKVLMLVHRLPLKKDLEQLFGDKLDNQIFISTYQSIAAQFQKGKDMIEDLKSYDYIVYDEAHYIWSDSSFNSTTEINKEVIDGLIGSVNQVIMTANRIPEAFEYDEFIEVGDINRFDYDIRERVDRAFLIQNDDHVRGILDKAIENNEKAVVFLNDTNMIERLYEQYKEYSTIYVSESNELAGLMDRDELKLLAEENRFEANILFATGVMNAGVSLKMRDLKHIIIKERKLEEVYQFIGRKRMLDENDKFNLYLINFHQKQLGGYLTALSYTIDMIETLKESELDFFRKFGRHKLDPTLFYISDDGGMKLNKVRELAIYEEYNEIQMMIDMEYKNFMRMMFMINIYDVIGREKKESIESKLDEFLGLKMKTVSDRKPLIETLNLRLNGRLLKNKESLNAAMEEKGLMYRIVVSSGSEVVDGKRKRYSAIWELRKIV